MEVNVHGTHKRRTVNVCIKYIKFRLNAFRIENNREQMHPTRVSPTKYSSAMSLEWQIQISSQHKQTSVKQQYLSKNPIENKDTKATHRHWLIYNNTVVLS